MCKLKTLVVSNALFAIYKTLYEIKYMISINLTYRRNLKKCDVDSIDLYLNIIKDELKKIEIENVHIEKNKLNFKIGLFDATDKWHIMGTVSKGSFEINLNNKTLIYTIILTKFFYMTLILSSILGIIIFLLNNTIIPWIVFFIFLFGLNYIITFFRHDEFISKLVYKLK